MQLKRTLLLIMLSLPGLILVASEPFTDTIALKAVSIEAPRHQLFATGSQVEVIERNVLEKEAGATISELLADNSSLNVTTYGPGGLSGVSLRGTKSSHTGINWQGFNINSTMNGGVNLSGIPTGFFNDISIQKGHCVTLYGSSSIGGIVHLNSTNKYDRGFWGNQSFSAGSFNTFKVNSKIGYSNKGSYHVAKYYHNRSDNDFSFRNASKINDPEEIQKNARYKTSAFLLEHGFRVGKADEINAAVWYEDIYKEIQPPMIREGDELQRDKNIRTSLQWIHNSQGLKWMYRSGYFRYYYRYKDLNEPQYNGMGETHKWVNDAEVRVRLRNNINASFGLNNSYEQAQVDYYEDDPDRMSQSAFISTKFYNIFDRIELVFNGRGELSDGKFLPPVFSVGSHIELPADIVLNASYSKSYQLPTFNDLYWIETKWTKGNENLKPESGHSFEAGLSKDHKHSNLKLHYAISFFTNRIEDMIKWLPNKAAQWRPVNLSMVRSKGIEMKYDVGYEANHWGLKSSTSYSYIDSKSVSKDNNGLYDEKNLVYEPDHSLNQSLRGTWKGWFLTYKHSFTGKRYYDYKHTLPAYHLGNLHAGITIPNQSSELTFSFRINNIWNTDYQVMAWYAMPLRNYLVEIKFKF